MKTLKYFSFVLFMIFFVGCQDINGPEPTESMEGFTNTEIPNNDPQFKAQNQLEPTPELLYTMSVTATTNRTMYPGGTFTHNIVIKNGTIPVSGAIIGIEDPIKQVCTWVKTNVFGVATYSTYVATSKVPGPFSLKFFYSTLKTWSTVFVKSSGVITLPNYSISANTSINPTNSTKINAETVSGYGNSISTTLNETANFGIEVVREYLKSPARVGVFGATLLTCGASLFVPPAGAVCAVGVKFVLKDFLKVGAMTLAHKMVNNATNLTTYQKTQLHSLIETSGIALSVAMFDPLKGFEAVESISTGWSVGQSTAKIFDYANKGASLSGVVNGTNKVYQISIYKN